jgi:hypothetical protein
MMKPVILVETAKATAEAARSPLGERSGCSRERSGCSLWASTPSSRGDYHAGAITTPHTYLRASLASHEEPLRAIGR